MTEEEKKKAEEAEAKKKEAEAAFESSIENLSEEEKETKRKEKEGQDNDNQIDYKAELEKAEEKRKKAEKALAQKRFGESEKERKEREAREDVDNQDDEDDKPLTSKQLQAILARERQETNARLNSSQIEKMATAIASSDDERKLIILRHKELSFPDDYTLEDQIEATYAFVNRKKLIGQKNEALRALKNKEGISRTAESAHHESAEIKGEPKLPDSTRSILKQSGYVWNNASKSYEKPLTGAGGRKLVYDHKTGKTSQAKTK